MGSGEEGLWAKVDYALVAGPAQPAEKESDSAVDAEKWRRFWRWRRPLLDAVATVFWLYAVLKVAFVDIDNDVLGDLADYRFFAFVAAAVGLAIILRRTGPIVGGFLYILGFPLVLLAWKLPKRLFRSRSSTAFLAVGNAIASILGDLRHSIITFAAAAFAGLVIATTTADVTLAVGGVVVAGLLAQAIARTVRFSVRPSRFMKLQQEAIRKIVESPMSRGMMSPAAELRRPDVVKFNEAQQSAFVQNLGHAVITHRAIAFWAVQLEAYRRGPATAFFNALAYLWLLARSIAALAFINLALYRADPASYAFSDPPTFLGFLRYSIAGLYGAEIDALHSQSDLADVLSIVAFLVGVAVVGSLVLSSVLSVRAGRERSEIEATIEEIRRQGTSLDVRVQQEYDVSVEEAERRLAQLRFGLAGLIAFFSTRIPRREP